MTASASASLLPIASTTTPTSKSRPSRHRVPKYIGVVLILCFVMGIYQYTQTHKMLVGFDFNNALDSENVIVVTADEDGVEDVEDVEEDDHDDDDDGDDEDDDGDDYDDETHDGEEEGETDTTVNVNVEEEEKKEEDTAAETNESQKEDTVVHETSEEIPERQEEEETKIDNKGTEQTQHKQLNVLVLYPDDWRHDSIGSEKPYVHTPFLNQLANEGIRFTQNAVTSSICWLSRATLWTGQYTSRHKSYKLKCPVFSEPENWKHSWVSILRNTGYWTGHIGKWQYHNDFRDFFDFAKPFEGQHWYNHNSKMVDGATLGRIHAVDFLENRPKDQPFALSIAFYPPKPVGVSREPGEQWMPTNETRKLYDNITIPEPEMNHSYHLLPDFLTDMSGARGPQVRWWERYRTSEHYQASMKNYYALITGVDQACKEIIDKLKEEGLYNNTMIIFTTDNGMMHGAHGLAGKWYPFQESIRVPLIVYDPRMPKEKVGTLDDSFTLNIDLAETILGAAGIKADETMQGRDISDLYLPNEKNEHHATASVDVEPWREDFFYEFPYDNERFIASSTALANKEWKYIHWHNHKREQLFNLKNDPLEMEDLYQDAESQTILESMRKRHGELRDEYHEINFLKDTCFGGPGLPADTSRARV